MCDVLYDALYYLIFSYLDFINKLNYRITCKKFIEYHITDLYNINTNITKKFNEHILKQREYANVTQINLQNRSRMQIDNLIF